MNFADVKEWRIPVNGIMTEVTKVTDSQNRVIWQKETGPDYTEPFYVENITNANETLSIVKSSSLAPTLTIEYSTDKSTWTTLGTTSTTALTLSLIPREKVYLKCNTNTWNANSIRGVSKVGGNIMSLLYGSNFTGQETSFPSGSTQNFNQLFYFNTNLVDTSELLLPATILVDRCYYRMFYQCTSLTSAPVLPAITLAPTCYCEMFRGCTSLTEAPALPVTILAGSCYQGMFWSCSSLTSAPTLPATTLAWGCYYRMFQGCRALTSAPALPATTLVNSCYYEMFQSCTLLTSAPTLPATTLVDSCYYRMFINCSSLNEVACYATSGINENSSTDYWLDNVASTGTFTKAAGVTWPTGNTGIPEGWTVVEV